MIKLSLTTTIVTLLMFLSAKEATAQEKVSPGKLIEILGKKDLKEFSTYLQGLWTKEEKLKSWPMRMEATDHFKGDSLWFADTSKFIRKMREEGYARDYDMYVNKIKKKASVYRLIEDPKASQATVADFVVFDNKHYQIDLATNMGMADEFRAYLKSNGFVKVSSLGEDRAESWESKGITVRFTFGGYGISIYFTPPKP